MSEGSEALRAAIDLLHLPSEVRHIRSKPLPEGVNSLLKVAANDRDAIEKAARLTGRSEKVIVESATFFIEQILFAPDANSYRVLGANSDACSSELRRNMALLIRWLHPDLEINDERSVFIGRVTSAWDDLKSKERRQSYDATLVHKSKKKTGRSNQTTRRGKSHAKKTNTLIGKHGQSMKDIRAGRTIATYQFNAPGRLRRVLLQLLGGRRS